MKNNIKKTNNKKWRKMLINTLKIKNYICFIGTQDLRRKTSLIHIRSLSVNIRSF